MESIRGARAVCRGIGEWIDDLQLLDDRAGPPVCDDERQRLLVLRANVNEVNIEPIDLGDELRESVQPRLALAPVVFGRPVARELLNRRELHALRRIRDRFPVRPPGRIDAPAQFGQFRFRNGIHLKRTNRGLVSCHDGLRGLWLWRGRWPSTPTSVGTPRGSAVLRLTRPYRCFDALQ